MSVTLSPVEVIRVLTLRAESKRTLVQLILYDTGALDFVVGDAVSGRVVLDEHREVGSLDGVRDAISLISGYL